MGSKNRHLCGYLNYSIVSWLLLLPVIAVSQPGFHGAATIATPNTIVNEYTSLTTDAATGATFVTVSSSALNSNSRFAGALQAGELVMLIQMQGASIDNSISALSWGQITSYNSCGLYELMEVASAPNASTIVFTCAIKNNYSLAGKTQVIRVPRYTTCTVSGGTLSCDPWNGNTGGVLVVESNGDFTVAAGAQVNVAGKGFRGGVVDNISSLSNISDYATPYPDYGGEKGESIAGFQIEYDAAGGRYGRGAPANGGGGGVCHNSGGGGGANAGTTLNWNGDGLPDTTQPAWVTAWNLEAPGFSTNSSEGGGRGGYDFSQSDQSALNTPPGSSAWAGHNRLNIGGKGGRPLNYSTGRLFLGGGGGSGDSNNSCGTSGGNGGGMVYLLSYAAVEGPGLINANGDNALDTQDGGNDGPAGGGGGGTVVIKASAGVASLLQISANGGAGGNQLIGDIEAEGPGGGGGGGYIACTGGAYTANVNGGVNGITTSTALTEFTPNGATKGAAGVMEQLFLQSASVSGTGDTVCAGSPATLTAIVQSSFSPAPTVYWYDSPVATNPVSSGTSFVTGALNNDTTLYISIDPCKPYLKIPVQATVSPSFALSSNVVHHLCYGDTTASATVLVNTNSSDPAYTYTWTGISSSAQNVQGLPAGSYTCVVKNSMGCADSITLVVTGPEPLQLTCLPDTICAYDPVTLNANVTGGTAPYQYNWSSGSANVSPGATTTYSLIITDNNGCTISGADTIYVRPLLQVSTQHDTICSGQPVILSAVATGGFGVVSYQWYDGSTLLGSGNSLAVSPASNISYLVVATDACSPPAVTDTVIVTVIQPDSLSSIVSPVLCFGNSTGAASVLVNGQTNPPGYQYYWPQLSATGSTVLNLAAGNYLCMVTNGFGCDNFLATAITQPALLTIDPLSDTLCAGASYTIIPQAGGGTTPYTYLWPLGSTVLTPVVNSTYTLTVTDNNACTQSTSIALFVHPPLALTVNTPDTICKDADALLIATTASGYGNYSYQWSTASTVLGTNDTLSVHPSASSVYQVIGYDACNSRDTALVQVSVFPDPIISLAADDTAGCSVLAVSFSCIFQGTPVSCSWNFGDSPVWQSISASGSVHYYTNAGDYIVSVTCKDVHGCRSDTTLLKYIHVYPHPVAAFATDVTEITAYSSEVNFINHSSGATQYWWNFGDTLYPASALVNPAHIYQSSDQAICYTIGLNVVNQYGCRDSTWGEICNVPTCAIYIPNAFTPNDDGKNEGFGPEGYGILNEDYRFSIFDRWGALIWQSCSWGEKWSGIANDGKEISQQDVFVWKLYCKDIFLKPHEMKGCVSLIR